MRRVQLGQQNLSPIKLINMTPVFVFSLVATVAVVGSLLFVMIQHARTYDEAESTQERMDDSLTDAADAEAGFDWKRAA